jgi:hypothetical protein
MRSVVERIHEQLPDLVEPEAGPALLRDSPKPKPKCSGLLTRPCSGYRLAPARNARARCRSSPRKCPGNAGLAGKTPGKIGIRSQDASFSLARFEAAWSRTNPQHQPRRDQLNFLNFQIEPLSSFCGTRGSGLSAYRLAAETGTDHHETDRSVTPIRVSEEY